MYSAGEIEIETVQHVLQMQTRFRFSLDTESALEEQRIRILAAHRKLEQIGERATERYVGCAIARYDSAVDELKGECQRHVGCTDADAFALQIRQTPPSGLAAEQMIDRDRHQTFVDCGRCESQPAAKYMRGFEHQMRPW